MKSYGHYDRQVSGFKKADVLGRQCGVSSCEKFVWYASKWRKLYYDGLPHPQITVNGSKIEVVLVNLYPELT